ncbi:hypothetical protein DFH27DRAFT_369783 [Peziza echinospora]|nr:hypothetical protein DFH27DRAFT_369783 [Peziza echinospora]
MSREQLNKSYNQTFNGHSDANLPPPADPGQPQLQTQGRHDALPINVDQAPPTPEPGTTPILKCGPLLRYCGTTYPQNGRGKTAVWRGTVLVILAGTEEGTPTPEFYYSAGPMEGQHSSDRTHTDLKGTTRRLVPAEATLILAEENTLFYRYPIEVELEEHERPVTYFIHGVEYGDDVKYESSELARNGNGKVEKVGMENPDKDDDEVIRKTVKLPPHTTHRTFYVPAAAATMRILFHSCNGFSVGTKEDEWSGPALWNDVLRHNRVHPFHIMIGGGDQIYSDAIRVSGPLKHWANMHNPARRRRYPYTPELETSVKRWYRENYIQWYGTFPFAKANGRIPQMNIWDDHDIIDGYGSYTDGFMRCPIFLGVGRAAWRYYMVFQHHTPPDGEPNREENSFIIGKTPGQYIGQRSRSLYARLGPSIAFLGLDARTERTRHQIVHPHTYDLVFDRLEKELDASNGEIQHVLLLLGVPIAYPRLVWLEALLRSPLAGILRFLNKRFGIASGAFNKFDGNIDILDDLDDHWCAAVHKRERNDFVRRLQALSLSRGVRITILSGDVHLAAIGRFYTRPSLLTNPADGSKLRVRRKKILSDAKEIPIETDHRYMPNIISSAITNPPPPPAVAKLLQRRNKVHHFDANTDERLLEFFDEDVDGKKMMSRVTMARRNYCVITQGEIAVSPAESSEEGWKGTKQRGEVLGIGEIGAGAAHAAAKADDVLDRPAPRTQDVGAVVKGPGGGDERIMLGALNVAIRVEIDKSDASGQTKSYGFNVPPYIPPSKGHETTSKAASNGSSY